MCLCQCQDKLAKSVLNSLLLLLHNLGDVLHFELMFSTTVRELQAQRETECQKRMLCAAYAPDSFPPPSIYPLCNDIYFGVI